eukprot:TRINITY_DN8931_c0_g1_i1.p1 TRINITY_DN8931_c0_g1~~TRINITY_DN8931_c0_g1_i1.p1  ORF type:complete len:222 (-),score=55.91 TRINITY_DN8931_c0_g1_i1:136-768(-)
MATIFGSINVETPKFTVLDKGEGYELREYQPVLRAEVEIPCSELSTGEGFRILANYIFGGNLPDSSSSPDAKQEAQGEQIAMTAPVITELAAPSTSSETMTSIVTEVADQSSRVKMSFVLPSKFTSLDQLPRPKDPQVKLVSIPSQKFAVSTFSGSTTEDVVKQKEEELRSALDRAGVSYTAQEKAKLWRYNPPWCLPFLRTNEVALKLI